MPGSTPPPAVVSQHQVTTPTPNPPDLKHVAPNACTYTPEHPEHAHQPIQQQQQQQQQHADPQPHPHPQPPPHHPAGFSWSSSLLTMLTTLGCFAVLCAYASAASTRFALHAAAPVYGLYPPLVAAMLLGGCAALICYAPTMLAVLAFWLLFRTDIRRRHSPPPPPRSASSHAQGEGHEHGHGHGNGHGHGHGQGAGLGAMGWSVLRDGASTIKLALVVAPVYVMALGRAGNAGVQSRALEAAAGGQLAAAAMTLRIMVVGVCEVWDLVPLVMFRWDRDAHARRR